VSLNRGDVILVDFEPARPTEANKIRPSILITNDQANLHGTNVVVVPLTSNVSRVYPFQLFLPSEQTGLDKDSKAQIELMRSVSKSRLDQRIGSLTRPLLEQLDERLKQHLGLT
jgi:mRNA interferase MazF